jgi:cobalt-zinc-cadmium efflux system membrane fusion protein
MRKNKKWLSGLFSLLFFLVISIVVINCSGKNKDDSHQTEKMDSKQKSSHEEEIVRITDGELKEFGIEIAIAGPGKLERHVDLNGEIVIDPSRLAHIVPRFPGVVKEVRKKIGSLVKKGEVLAIIESNESLALYEVKSLINGKVIDMHLTLGEVIADEGHSFIIADLSKVWINLNVYQKDLSFIKIGLQALISTGLSSKEKTGKISYISPVVDEKTRTATARVVLENSNGTWKPGLFVTAQVIIGSDTVPIMVPKTALETFENRTVIFVKHEAGFSPQPVTIGRTNSSSVEIVAGLKPGQKYVSKGGFTLKAELQKEAFGEGHEH